MVKSLFFIPLFIISSFSHAQNNLHGEVQFWGEITESTCIAKPYQKIKNIHSFFNDCDIQGENFKTSRVKVTTHTFNKKREEYNKKSEQYAQISKKNKSLESAVIMTVYIAEYK